MSVSEPDVCQGEDATPPQADPPTSTEVNK